MGQARPRPARIRNLVRHIEEREKAEHALKRILEIAKGEDGALLISTTDAKLARAIGEALHSACRGDLSDQFVESESCFRATWFR